MPQPAWEATLASGVAPSSGSRSIATSGSLGFAPPYVIANVALAEDPTVHLTTNVVGCDPDDVHIGQEVTVRFEQHDDVWLPLFEPAGAQTAVVTSGGGTASGVMLLRRDGS